MRSRNPSNGAYQWMNMKSYGLPHGLGLGGSLEGFRIFLPENYENCVARDSCPTYESGRLVKGENFEIECIEVWACGGNEAIQHGFTTQKQIRKVANENIEKARKVDKAAFFDNAFDREFLLANTFSHENQSKERPEV
jgi:hypothetical protein